MQILAGMLIPASLAPLSAQDTLWSLDSCVNYALVHNITVRQRQADMDMGTISYEDARNGYMPTLGAGASEGFSFGRGLTADNTYANRNTSSFGWNVSLSVPLTYMAGQGQARVSQSRTYLTTLFHQCEATKDDVELNVMAQYLQVLYCNEMLNVAREQMELSQHQLDERRKMFDAGRIAQLDIAQAESQVAQDSLSVVNASGDLEMALLDMVRLLQLPDEDSKGFGIKPLAGEPSVLPDVESVYRTALSVNNAIQVQRDNVEYARQGITVAKTAYIPSLGLSAGMGSSYYRMGGVKVDGFGNQMRHNFSQSVNLSVSVPLFDAFSRHNGVRRARASHLSAMLQLDAARDQLYKTISTAHTQAVNAGARLEAASVAAQAALAALEAVDRKYSRDRATPTEVEQAKNTYYRARSEQVRARFERLLRERILQFYCRQGRG